MYDARRKRIKHSELKEKRKRRQWVLSGVGVCVLLLVFASFVWIARQEWFLIQDIYIDGTSVLAEEDIRELVEKGLAGARFGMIPRSNTLLLDKSSLEKELRIAFSRIKDVSFDREGKKGLNVVIEEYMPHALWCGISRTELANDDSESCYFIDEFGYIFASAPTFSGSAYFKYYGDIGVEEPLRAQIFSQNELLSIQELLLALKRIPLEPVYLEETSDADYKVALQSGIYILFAPKYSLMEQVVHVGALIASKDFIEERARMTTPLEYIDVRFENKIYYRFESEVEKESE